jgi:ribokinase
VRVAVVGHVEWVEFLRVERVPLPGEIVQVTETWAEAAGGGADAAVQLAKLAGSSQLYTALGDDEIGHRAFAQLGRQGVRVEVAWRAEPQRRAFCYVDATGERTITLLSPKLAPRRVDPLPWNELADIDGVYFTGGDAGAVQAARAARALVATARELPTLRAAAVTLDVLVASASDQGERYEAGQLEPAPRFVVRTEGARGGTVEPGGRFPAVAVPGPISDVYGAGDAFAAGLTYGLAENGDLPGALDLAARCGAAVLTGRGPYERPLTLARGS